MFSHDCVPILDFLARILRGSFELRIYWPQVDLVTTYGRFSFLWDSQGQCLAILSGVMT